MSRAIRCVAALALLAAAGSGCVARTTPIELGPQPGVVYDEKRVRQVEGRGCGFTLSGIPVTTPQAYERAYDDLRREAPFEYLGEIEAQPYWRYAVFGVFHCVRLVASAYEVPAPTAPARSPQPEADPEGSAGETRDSDPAEAIPGTAEAAEREPAVPRP